MWSENCIVGLPNERNVNNAYVGCHLQALWPATHQSAILILKKYFRLFPFSQAVIYDPGVVFAAESRRAVPNCDEGDAVSIVNGAALGEGKWSAPRIRL